MFHYANHHGFPIITSLDTPGAYPDLKSEELAKYVSSYALRFSFALAFFY